MTVAGSLTAFLASWIVGSIGIYIGASLITDGTSLFSAAASALLGAAAWGLVTYFVGTTGLGAVLALFAWILIIDWRHRGGLINATLIGVASWLSALLILYILATFGVTTPDALGIPAV